MSSNITNISHGQANWDTAINQNFQNLDADSGWVKVPLLAPFDGVLQIRRRAHYIDLWGVINATESIATSTGTTIVVFPDNLFPEDYNYADKYFTSYMDGVGGMARLCLTSKKELRYFSGSSDPVTLSIRISKMISI